MISYLVSYVVHDRRGGMIAECDVISAPKDASEAEIEKIMRKSTPNLEWIDRIEEYRERYV